MNKYSYIAILLAVVIGFVAGYLVLGSSSDKAQLELIKKYEVKLKQKEDSSKKVIYNLDRKLLILNEKTKIDSIKITSLLFKIQQDGVRTEQKRKQASKFTPNESKDFILDRYK